MIKNKDEGYVNAKRRQHMLSLTSAALCMAGLGVGNAWGAGSKPNVIVTSIPKPEKRNITISTTSASALPYLPLLVAQHKGFFEQHGLKVEISEQQSAARAIAAVGAAGADVACGWLEHMLSAPGRALALQSFVLLGKAPMMAMGLSTRLSSANVSSSLTAKLAQLRGRKIGVVALNSPTHTLAQATLRRGGLRASDVGFVSVGSPTSAQAALRSGQIDALMHLDPLMLELEQRSEIFILADLRSPLSAHEVLGMHLPSSCVAAPQDFLQGLPGTAQACSDALVQALQWLAQASLKDLLQLQQSFSPISQESAPALDAQSFVASYERLRLAYSSDGICTAQSASDLLQVMHDAEPSLRLEKIDAMRSVNNTLAQRSLIRLKT